MTTRDNIDREVVALEWERALQERRIEGNPYAPAAPTPPASRSANAAANMARRNAVAIPQGRQAEANAYAEVWAGEMPQLERDWQAKICAVADELGWDWQHCRQPQQDRPGFPDLVLWHPTMHVHAFRELKRDGEKPTDPQTRRYVGLVRAGADVDVWHFPSDWDRAVAWLADPHGLGR